MDDAIKFVSVLVILVCISAYYEILVAVPNFHVRLLYGAFLGSLIFIQKDVFFPRQNS